VHDNLALLRRSYDSFTDAISTPLLGLRGVGDVTATRASGSTDTGPRAGLLWSRPSGRSPAGAGLMTRWAIYISEKEALEAARPRA
jgi:hypothetical protein